MKKIITATAMLVLGLTVAIAPSCNKDQPSTGDKDFMKGEKGTTGEMMVTPGQMPPLNAEEKHIIVNKGTERPFTGKYLNTFDKGVYVCRRCGSPLYTSKSKFKADCGWPAFDQEIPGAVKKTIDADGQRTEITCAHCGAHLGHVFFGEGYTDTNTRHCVNSTSLVFRPAKMPDKLQRAIFAGGCFWGVEHLLQKMPGIKKITVGYTGGTTKNPTYEEVCSGNTGHVEAVEVVFDPKKVTYEQLARRFFEIHDPTQVDRQGPDIGTQYRSEIFYFDEAQKKTCEKLIKLLKNNGYDVVTKLRPASTFYPAEKYHQNYLDKNPGGYMCHSPVDRFKIKAAKPEFLP